MIYSKTLFIDIDGTILEFYDPFEEVVAGKIRPKALPKVKEFLMKAHKEGDKIILVTGRPEAMRTLTIESLKEEGIIYDQLVMAVGAGPRYLINDRGGKVFNKAIAVNIETNGCFPDIMNSML